MISRDLLVQRQKELLAQHANLTLARDGDKRLAIAHQEALVRNEGALGLVARLINELDVAEGKPGQEDPVATQRPADVA